MINIINDEHQMFLRIADYHNNDLYQGALYVHVFRGAVFVNRTEIPDEDRSGILALMQRLNGMIDLDGDIIYMPVNRVQNTTRLEYCGQIIGLYS